MKNETTKKCWSCKLEKELISFHKDKSRADGYSGRCKSCKAKSQGKSPSRKSILRAKNDELRKIGKKMCSKCVKVKSLESFYFKNRSKGLRKPQCASCFNVSSRGGRTQNKLGLELWGFNQDKSDKFAKSCRMRILHALKSKGYSKKSSSQKIIGCSWSELRAHIEKQFRQGMCWENHGLYGWHVDHVIPLASASSVEEMLKLCHYTNLQPLWAEENLKKGAKCEFEL